MSAPEQDLLGHVQAGDRPDPTGSPAGCPATHKGYGCTRMVGHPGQHIAGTGRYVAATWLADGSGFVEAYA